MVQVLILIHQRTTLVPAALCLYLPGPAAPNIPTQKAAQRKGCQKISNLIRLTTYLTNEGKGPSRGTLILDDF